MMDWLNDPTLKDMDPLKKELFSKAASQLHGKSGNSMASTLMTLITSANQHGVKFTSEEISLILNIMMLGKDNQK